MEAIYSSGYQLKLAISLPDDRGVTKSGRVYIDDLCQRHGTPLLKVRHIDDQAAVDAIKEHGLDWLFIIGWSQIAGRAILQAPSAGVLGMHPTLLPMGRGRAAIPWAILKQLPETGVTLFQLSEGVDTGPILAQRKISLHKGADANWLYERVVAAHADLIREVVPQLTSGELFPVPQDESKATFWPGRTPEDGRMDLSGSAFDAERLVRAVTRPYPGAFIDIEGRRLTVWKAEVCGSNCSGFCLRFQDGWLRCIDYTWSPLDII
jgi:methionyl-tRNA formyltransferase